MSVFQGACARETIFGTIATICKTTRCRKHLFLSSAALARPCTQPCRPCWQGRSPFLCSDDRKAGASTVTSVCRKTLAPRPSTGNVVALHAQLACTRQAASLNRDATHHVASGVEVRRTPLESCLPHRNTPVLLRRDGAHRAIGSLQVSSHPRFRRSDEAHPTDLAFPLSKKRNDCQVRRKRPGDPVACRSVNDLIQPQRCEVLAFHKSSCATQTLFLPSTSEKDGGVLQEGLVKNVP